MCGLIATARALIMQNTLSVMKEMFSSWTAPPVEWNSLVKSTEVTPEVVAPPSSVMSTEWRWRRA